MAEIVSSGDLDLDLDLGFNIDAIFADEPALDFALVMPLPLPEAPPEKAMSSSPESSVESGTSCWMNELEQFLLTEDGGVDDGKEGSDLAEGFFADVFAHYGGKEERIEESSGEDEKVEKDQVVDGDGRTGCGSKEENGEEEDMIDKKRIRQMRNRDSAMKSRERRRIYVRNLEMKSKFLEAECKRLGHLLHCCTAENIVLKNCLRKDRACGVSQAKQESAVLLEESLPLGSLFWLVITVFLFLASNLPAWSLPARVTAGARGGQGAREKLVVLGTKRSGHERFGEDLECESLFMRRRYRALKPKMKTLVTCH